MGRTSVLGDVLAARPSVAIKSGASPRPPLLTHTVTLGTGEVYMLGTEDTQASGKRSSTELTSSFPSVSFNILGPKMDSRFSGQGYFVFTHRTDLIFFLSEWSTRSWWKAKFSLPCLLYDRNYPLF